MRLSRIGLVSLALCLFAGVASSGNLSFTGVFTQDDQLHVFLFTAPAAGAIVRSWSYAGGTNAAGQLIAAGGFDPVLSVFDATGGLLGSSLLIDSNNDGLGVAADPVTKNPFDSLLVLAAAGTYALVLSENDNIAAGPTYGDGFSHTGDGNFTAGEFGCPGSAPFCDASTAQRNGQWAVDILGAGSVTAATPEPGSCLFIVTGIASLALLRRRGKQA